MYCRFCATELPDNSKFCPSCGKPVTEETSSYTDSISAQVERERKLAAFTQDEKDDFDKQIKTVKIIKVIGKVFFILLALPVFLLSLTGGFWPVVIVTLIILGLYWFFHSIFHMNDCPKCKSFGTMENTRSDFQGTAFTAKHKDHNSHFNVVRHYQVCYKCGYSRIVDRLG